MWALQVAVVIHQVGMYVCSIRLDVLLGIARPCICCMLPTVLTLAIASETGPMIVCLI